MGKKNKLTVDEQIAHMKEQGIQFSVIEEEQARLFLRNNTYYFKVKAYAKNYQKYVTGINAGRYINLDFAYLQELSTLDAQLRKFVIKTTLDIEHFLKVQLLRHLEQNDKEDGYHIVKDFLHAFPNVTEDIEKRRNNSNCFELIEKYQSDFAVWNIVEVLTFRQLIDLYELCFSYYNSKDSLKNCLKPIQFLRNAAAHNNCLIHRLEGPHSRKINPNKKVENFVSTIPTIKATARNKKMQNPVMHDFVTMLYVYTRVVTSEPTRQHMIDDLQDLLERFMRNKQYFTSNMLVLSYLDFSKNLLTFFRIQHIIDSVEQMRCFRGVFN